MILLLVGLILIIVGLASTTIAPCFKDSGSEIEWRGATVNCSVTVGVLIALLVGFIIGIAISIYFWICVYSFYVDLKKQQIPQPA